MLKCQGCCAHREEVRLLKLRSLQSTGGTELEPTRREGVTLANSQWIPVHLGSCSQPAGAEDSGCGWVCRCGGLTSWVHTPWSYLLPREEAPPG